VTRPFSRATVFSLVSPFFVDPRSFFLTEPWPDPIFVNCYPQAGRNAAVPPTWAQGFFFPFMQIQTRHVEKNFQTFFLVRASLSFSAVFLVKAPLLRCGVFFFFFPEAIPPKACTTWGTQTVPPRSIGCYFSPDLFLMTSR